MDLTNWYDTIVSNIVTALETVFLKKNDVLNKTYPIGSIYMSVNNTNPNSLFGGTWQQLEDTFLYATSGTADTGYQATAGSKDAVVVTHNHTQTNHSHGMAHTHSHNHTLSGFSSGSGSANAYAQSTNRKQTDRSVSTDATASSKSSTDGATANINDTGVDGTDKNMPPYMKVYMWKRTA